MNAKHQKIANKAAPEASQPAARPQGPSVVAAQWQGPLPPPGALQQFDDIIPNGAERIMVMCEKEQAARIASDRRASIAEIAIEGGGRLVGALLVLACVSAAVWSIHLQSDWKVTLGFLSVPVMGALAKLFERRGK